MSEPQARSGGPRGRGSGRGGRGGYSARGGRPRPAQPNGSKADASAPTAYEDEGEMGELKKRYSSKLTTIKEMFPDWTDEDIVFALEETDGDLEGTIERISEGNISQWGEVKKKTKDRARSKVKESANEETPTHIRGGRGRGSDNQRGGRGRGTERGRGAGRGRGGPSVNGAKKPVAADTPSDAVPPANEPSDWDASKDAATNAETAGQQAKPDEDTDTASWEMVTPAEAAPPAPDSQKAGMKPDGTRSWASMLRPAPKPKAAPVATKVKTPPAAVPKPAPVETAEPQVQLDGGDNGAPPPDGSAGDIPATPQSPSVAPSESAANITPSKDELTETNLEQVADTSNPVATETVASNAGTNDPRGITASLTPAQAPQSQPAARPVLGGFATTALKATSSSGRTSSYQRRLKEQQEAVVMPGNHAVDRAAVQFGSMGLGGEAEDLDVDDDREDAETRAQPPQHSPVAPRASLPPAPQQTGVENVSTSTRPAPGLPPVPQAAQQEQHPYGQFNAYGAPSSQSDTTASATKPYEPFGQQAQQAGSHHFDSYPPQSHAPGQPAQAAQQGQAGAFSTAGNDYSAHYSTADNQRNPYGGYYNSAYGQYGQPGPHDSNVSQQRNTGAFGTSGSEQASIHAHSQGQQPAQSRFGAAADSQASGHSTPNPPLGQQHSQHQSHQMGHGQPGGHGFPYSNHPYFSSPYYSQYMNQVSPHQPYHGRHRPPFDDVRRYDEQVLTHNDQYGYGGSQGGYGSGPYGGGGGKYGQPHQGYGMSPQTSYDPHSASPATVGGYGQQPHSIPSREGASGLGGYGRAGSTQPSDSQTHSSGAFGGMSDVFNRSQSNYTQSSQQSGNQQSASDENRYGDSSKIAGGPSPAPGQVGGGRPGSAANVQGQGGLPGSQGQGQQGYGGYPSQMNHQMHGQQSQYSGGLGGLGGHHQSGGQSHQSSGYGGYGGGFGGGNNYNYNNRGGGWGGNYGH